MSHFEGSVVYEKTSENIKFDCIPRIGNRGRISSMYNPIDREVNLKVPCGLFAPRGYFSDAEGKVPMSPAFNEKKCIPGYSIEPKFDAKKPQSLITLKDNHLSDTKNDKNGRSDRISKSSINDKNGRNDRISKTSINDKNSKVDSTVLINDSNLVVDKCNKKKNSTTIEDDSYGKSIISGEIIREKNAHKKSKTYSAQELMNFSQSCQADPDSRKLVTKLRTSIVLNETSVDSAIKRRRDRIAGMQEANSNVNVITNKARTRLKYQRVPSAKTDEINKDQINNVEKIAKIDIQKLNLDRYRKTLNVDFSERGNWNSGVMALKAANLAVSDVIRNLLRLNVSNIQLVPPSGRRLPLFFKDYEDFKCKLEPIVFEELKYGFKSQSDSKKLSFMKVELKKLEECEEWITGTFRVHKTHSAISSSSVEESVKFAHWDVLFFSRTYIESITFGTDTLPKHCFCGIVFKDLLDDKSSDTENQRGQVRFINGTASFGESTSKVVPCMGGTRKVVQGPILYCCSLGNVRSAVLALQTFHLYDICSTLMDLLVLGKYMSPPPSSNPKLNHDLNNNNNNWWNVHHEFVTKMGGLNFSQAESIKNALFSPSRISLVQGPPGTGKTKTILSILSVIFSILFADNPTEVACLRRDKTAAGYNERKTSGNIPKILVCATSNAAVDEIAIRVLNQGLNYINCRYIRQNLEEIKASKELATTCTEKSTTTRSNYKSINSDNRHLSEVVLKHMEGEKNSGDITRKPGITNNPVEDFISCSVQHGLKHHGSGTDVRYSLPKEEEKKTMWKINPKKSVHCEKQCTVSEEKVSANAKKNKAIDRNMYNLQYNINPSIIRIGNPDRITVNEIRDKISIEQICVNLIRNRRSDPSERKLFEEIDRSLYAIKTELQKRYSKKSSSVILNPDFLGIKKAMDGNNVSISSMLHWIDSANNPERTDTAPLINKFNSKDLSHLSILQLNRFKTELLKSKKKLFERESLAQAKDRLKVFLQADIHFATLAGSANIFESICRAFSDPLIRFDFLIVDEASQCNLLDILVPLRLCVKKIIMIGDENQLDSFAGSPWAIDSGYGTSIFHRCLTVLEADRKYSIKRYPAYEMCISEIFSEFGKTNFSEKNVSSFMSESSLKVQYRMPVDICRLPSLMFYNSELLTTKSLGNFQFNAAPLNSMYNLIFAPLKFFHVNSIESRRNQSIYNSEEAYFVVRLLHLFLCSFVFPAMLITNNAGGNKSLGQQFQIFLNLFMKKGKDENGGNSPVISRPKGTFLSPKERSLNNIVSSRDGSKKKKIRAKCFYNEVENIHIITPDDISILTPYREQVGELKEAFYRFYMKKKHLQPIRLFFSFWRDRINKSEKYINGTTIKESFISLNSFGFLPEICTVDSFQGRENKVIVLSTVRASKKYYWESNVKKKNSPTNTNGTNFMYASELFEGYDQKLGSDVFINTRKWQVISKFFNNKKISSFYDTDGLEPFFMEEYNKQLYGQAVQDNAAQGLGFICDYRRFNVAITRSKMCLWVVGNSFTLYNDQKIWRQLLLYSRNCYYRYRCCCSRLSALKMYDSNNTIKHEQEPLYTNHIDRQKNSKDHHSNTNFGFHNVSNDAVQMNNSSDQLGFTKLAKEVYVSLEFTGESLQTTFQETTKSGPNLLQNHRTTNTSGTEQIIQDGQIDIDDELYADLQEKSNWIFHDAREDHYDLSLSESCSYDDISPEIPISGVDVFPREEPEKSLKNSVDSPKALNLAEDPPMEEDHVMCCDCLGFSESCGFDCDARTSTEILENAFIDTMHPNILSSSSKWSLSTEDNTLRPTTNNNIMPSTDTTPTTIEEFFSRIENHLMQFFSL